MFSSFSYGINIVSSLLQSLNNSENVKVDCNVDNRLRCKKIKRFYTEVDIFPDQFTSAKYLINSQ